MTVNVTDSPADMPLPFHGKRRLVQRGPWVPCVFWMTGGTDEDARYWAWVNGVTWEVLDPLECQAIGWPWHACDDDEWTTLYQDWEKRNAHQ